MSGRLVSVTTVTVPAPVTRASQPAMVLPCPRLNSPFGTQASRWDRESQVPRDTPSASDDTP